MKLRHTDNRCDEGHLIFLMMKLVRKYVQNGKAAEDCDGYGKIANDVRRMNNGAFNAMTDEEDH
ncbi:hypothetical protein T01_718 [Trichinella spiralis]|uniref:Uncharacterized protein n=1 Tax=Trichinella spiralis TaxID=6334 RepID=A0A0V1AMM2_TRISP|nr:hypothetical protein T01_718 [Trichinella spiralis]